jgi:hypothetical protein
MNSNNRHVPRVIELARSGDCDPITSHSCWTVGLSPRRALYYNDHPDAIIEDFDRSQYRAVLREIERHVIEWERQQTEGQTEWVASARRRKHLSTRAAARAIVAALRA